MDDAVLLKTSLFKVAGNPPASPLLLRTADIRNGRLVPVDLSGDWNQPMLKPSEDLVYEKNTMGVWSWSPAAPAPMGARTCERPDIRPVRIAKVQATSDEEVLEAALAGIEAPEAAFRTLFAYPVPGGLRGFLCEAEDMQSDGDILRVKGLPVVALFHDVREEDIITLYKNLPPGASELTFVANARGFSRPGEPYPTRNGEERVAGLVYRLITSPAFQRRAALLGGGGASEVYEELLGPSLDERAAGELGLSEAAAAVVTAAFRERAERVFVLHGAAGDAVAGLLLMHRAVRERCERIVRRERERADAAVPEDAENELSSAETELSRLQAEIQAAKVHRDELLAEAAALEDAAARMKETEEDLSAGEGAPAVLAKNMHLGEELAAAEARKAALQEEISDLEELRATALSDLYEEVERCREIELDIEKGLHELIGHEAADVQSAASDDEIAEN